MAGAKKSQSSRVKSVKRAGTKKKKAGTSFISRRTKFLSSAFAAVAVLLTGIFFVTTQAATTYTAFVGPGGKCLDNDRQLKANNNPIQLYSCNATSAQAWTINTTAATITNQNGYCLDSKDGSLTAQAPVVIRECQKTAASQQWTINTNGTITQRASGLCLDDKGGSTADRTPIQLYSCNTTAAQKWTKKTFPAVTTSPSGQAAPTGNISGWKQIFVDDFKGTVPKGAFSDCNHNPDRPSAYCGGLKKYGSYYTNWWAYPNNWDDTAKSKADGNTQAPFGGTYHPEKTVSVSNGLMHIAMYRPKTGGDNVVGTVVPRKCMDRKYGRFVERFRVSHADKGFKSAHLFYRDGFEVDYPENDYWQTISAYTHPGNANFGTSAKWTSWHTTAIEWTESSIKFYMDGKLIGTTKNKVPHIAMNWVLQNESSINGPYAKPGASAQLDIDWVACYAPAK